MLGLTCSYYHTKIHLTICKADWVIGIYVVFFRLPNCGNHLELGCIQRLISLFNEYFGKISLKSVQLFIIFFANRHKHLHTDRQLHCYSPFIVLGNNNCFSWEINESTLVWLHCNFKGTIFLPNSLNCSHLSWQETWEFVNH